MVLRSDSVCPIKTDWQQFTMQDRVLNPSEDVLSCSRPSIERRFKPPTESAQKCPRCESLNTKFCYYNNYSQSQPRHFCKNCRRYWTKGGVLRNVPVGGGCRKNKRIKQTSTEEQPSTNHYSEPVTATAPGQNSSCTENLSTGSLNSLYYNLSDADRIDLSVFSHTQQASHTDQPSLVTCRSEVFGGTQSSQLSSLPYSTLASLSNHLSSLGSLQHLRTSCLGLDFPGIVYPEQSSLEEADLTTFFESTSHKVAGAGTVSTSPDEGGHAFSLGLDTFGGVDPDVQRKAHEEKLALQSEGNHMLNGFVSMPSQNHQQQAVDSSLRDTKPQVEFSVLQKVDSLGADRQPGKEAYYPQSAERGYWNIGDTWLDLREHGSSAHPLL